MTRPPQDPWKDAKFYRRDRGRRKATLFDRVFLIIVGAGVGAVVFWGGTFVLVADSYRYGGVRPRASAITTTEFRERGYDKLLWGIGILGAIVGGVTTMVFLRESDETDDG